MQKTNIKTARVAAGLHQYVLAGRVCINTARLSRIENGHVEATPRERRALSAALSTSEADLFQHEGAEDGRS